MKINKELILILFFHACFSSQYFIIKNRFEFYCIWIIMIFTQQYPIRLFEKCCFRQRWPNFRIVPNSKFSNLLNKKKIKIPSFIHVLNFKNIFLWKKLKDCISKYELYPRNLGTFGYLSFDGELSSILKAEH